MNGLLIIGGILYLLARNADKLNKNISYRLIQIRLLAGLPGAQTFAAVKTGFEIDLELTNPTAASATIKNVVGKVTLSNGAVIARITGVSPFTISPNSSVVVTLYAKTENPAILTEVVRLVQQKQKPTVIVEGIIHTNLVQIPFSKSYSW